MLIPFSTWRERNPEVIVMSCPEPKTHRVFSGDPALWHLSDYRVLSCISGPSVLLVPRDEWTDYEARS